MSASAQAAGRIEPESRHTMLAHEGAAQCGICTVVVRLVCEEPGALPTADPYEYQAVCHGFLLTSTTGVAPMEEVALFTIFFGLVARWWQEYHATSLPERNKLAGAGILAF